MNKKTFVITFALLAALSTFAAKITDNDLKLGDNIAGDKTIYFREGSATPPLLRWDESDSAICVANDGATCKTLNDLTDMTGVLPIANGGTNSSTALNNNRIMVSSGGSIVEAAALTNGQLLIGSTGAAPVAATITQGDADRVTVVNGAGTITLSTPQDINTTSSPTFVDMILTGFLQLLRRDENGTASVTALSTTTSYVKLTSGGTPVTTIRGADSGINAKALIINNDTGATVTIKHLDAPDTNDSFKLPGATDISLADDESAFFIYDDDADKWVTAAGYGSGGGGGGGTSRFLRYEIGDASGTGSTCSMTVTSTTFAALGTDADCDGSTRTNLNMGTITQTADSNQVNWTPPVNGDYEVCAYYTNAGDTNWQHMQLWHAGANDLGRASAFPGTTNNMGTICGVIQSSGTSSQTLELRCKAPSLACGLATDDNSTSELTPTISWVIQPVGRF